MAVVAGIILIFVSAALLFVVVFGIFYAIDFFLELPYVGAKKEMVNSIFRLANVKKGQTVVDLGSGDGRLLFEAANLGAFAQGYEINPFMVLLSRARSKLKGLDDQIIIKNQSMWKADLKIADVIFVYSLKSKMKKFEDFIWKNASKGTRVIVNTNPFPTKKPTKSLDKIFLYIV